MQDALCILGLMLIVLCIAHYLLYAEIVKLSVQQIIICITASALVKVLLMHLRKNYCYISSVGYIDIHGDVTHQWSIRWTKYGAIREITNRVGKDNIKSMIGVIKLSKREYSDMVNRALARVEEEAVNKEAA